MIRIEIRPPSLILPGHDVDRGPRQRRTSPAGVPGAREKVFLAHAGDCPLPRRVAEAVSQYALHCATGDQEQFVYPTSWSEDASWRPGCWAARPDEVAFVGPTSLALSFFASGLKFRRHDNILIYFDDYPSNVYPWMALAEQGVEVRLMNTRGLGLIRPRTSWAKWMKTRVWWPSPRAISSAVTGWTSQAIGKFLHERNILFCLDAIQTLGAFPLPLEHVDMLAADAHKWLLGPCGAGLMYVRRALQDALNPPIYGWNNVRCPDFVAQEQLVLRTGAPQIRSGHLQSPGPGRSHHRDGTAARGRRREHCC